MSEWNDKRIRVIVGHYGSGKTEFSVNYALQIAKHGRKTALVDLDIANPYFRSRERQELLEDKGVSVFSNTFGHDITADLPAITARIRAPLENQFYQTIVDAGGDESGARILVQFSQYFTRTDSDIFCIVNGNRPETRTVEGARGHIERIQAVSGLKVTGLINNTHLVHETSVNDILNGYRLCDELSQKLGIPLKYNCCVKPLLPELEEKVRDYIDFVIFPLTLYMRESWF